MTAAPAPTRPGYALPAALAATLTVLGVVAIGAAKVMWWLVVGSLMLTWVLIKVTLWASLWMLALPIMIIVAILR